MPDYSQFAPLVASPAPVRSAFDHTPAGVWWTVIMALHGKPVDVRASDAGRIACLAAGFRFYAQLYGSLAAVFGLIAAFFATFRADVGGLGWGYCAAGSLLMSIYLAFVVSVGFAGSREMANRREQAVPLLIVFMAMVVAFLAGLLAVLSVIVEATGVWPAYANLATMSALFTVGVGSYFIEIVYLATEGNRLMGSAVRVGDGP
jgi:hypothetical protein